MECFIKISIMLGCGMGIKGSTRVAIQYFIKEDNLMKKLEVALRT